MIDDDDDTTTTTEPASVASQLDALFTTMDAAGLEERPAQREVMRIVARNLEPDPDTKLWSAIEAPCGVGKSLGYLVPGAMHVLELRKKPVDKDAPPRRLIVSTAGQALQSQIALIDAPKLRKLLNIDDDDDLRVVVMKSRTNYACPSTIKDAIDKGSLDYDRDMRIHRIKALVEAKDIDSDEWTWDGDRERLPAEESDDVDKWWSDVSLDRADDCGGKACAFYKGGMQSPCPAIRASAKASSAHVVVVNHHYLCMGKPEGFALIVDEAHELEDAARSALQDRFTVGSVKAWAAKAAGYVSGGNAVADMLYRVLDAARAACPPNSKDEKVLRQGWFPAVDASTIENRLQVLIADLEAEARKLGCQNFGAKWVYTGEAGTPLAKHASGLCAFISRTVKLTHRVGVAMIGSGLHEKSRLTWAVWAEPFTSRRDEASVALHVAPSDIRPIIKGLLKSYHRGVFLTATLPSDDLLTSSMGLTGGSTLAEKPLRLPSPFDLPRQGLMVIPRGPSPKDAPWAEWSLGHVVEAVVASNGRALVLATSKVRAGEYAKALRADRRLAGVNVLLQGEGSRAVLSGTFRDDTASVLCGTRSFFTGLDVQGESLSLVIVDKIPFDRFGDPVETVIGEQLKSEKLDPYRQRTLPRAAMVLVQAIGRLIRSKTDTGVAVILDPRLHNGRAWEPLLKALPPFELVERADAVASWFNGSYQRTGRTRPVGPPPPPPTHMLDDDE